MSSHKRRASPISIQDHSHHPIDRSNQRIHSRRDIQGSRRTYPYIRQLSPPAALVPDPAAKDHDAGDADAAA
jgi:hypothetical protein